MSVFFFSNSLTAQLVNEAALAIGTSGNDIGSSITEISDGGFVVTGYSSCSICPTDLYLFKLDSAYSLKWTRAVGGSNDDYGYSAIQAINNNLISVGFTSSYGAGGGGIYVVKVNSLGNMLWSETIEGQNGYSIAQTDNRGVIIAGYNSCSHCHTKMYLINLDSIGALNWAKTIGGLSNDTAFSVIQTVDKGYAVTGSTESFGAGGNDVYIVKLDSIGNIQWTKTIGGTGNDAAYSIIQTKDKGYALAGGTTSFGAGREDGYIIKLDSLGNIKWTRTLGGIGDDIVKSIIQTHDGGFVAAGSSTSSNIGNNSPYFIKLDSLGNLKWSRAIGGGTSSSCSIIQTKQGGYVATGTTSFFGAGGTDALVITLDINGNTCLPYDSTFGITSVDSGRVNTGGVANGYTPIVSIDTSASDTGGVMTNYCSRIQPTAISTITSSGNLSVFPNPTSNNITLHYLASAYAPITISIFDIAGNNINSFLRSRNADDSYTLPTYTLVPGMYFIEVDDNYRKLYAKFIKE